MPEIKKEEQFTTPNSQHRRSRTRAFGGQGHRRKISQHYLTNQRKDSSKTFKLVPAASREAKVVPKEEVDLKVIARDSERWRRQSMVRLQNSRSVMKDKRQYRYIVGRQEVWRRKSSDWRRPSEDFTHIRNVRDKQMEQGWRRDSPATPSKMKDETVAEAQTALTTCSEPTSRGSPPKVKDTESSDSESTEECKENDLNRANQVLPDPIWKTVQEYQTPKRKPKLQKASRDGITSSDGSTVVTPQKLARVLRAI
jgi:hypothetical protein